ncbi:TonB-dependent receptor plug domain-containing protein [Ferrimonas kyonanensis]|uniref:TonB-dependent receptor plug domain-containing protein n=1 Tax=Ferrimonas kyonanensis TaxID=364763 RepID=UPI00042242BD|nr:TonB-dependent receptor [Ferrimonas kyonanensis]
MNGLRLTPVAMMIAATLSTPAAMADDKEVFSLGEIVVAETTGVRDIAIHNVLTAETIELVGAKTAADALEYVPGVHVAQSNKGEKFLTMQGFEQDKILILLDGVPYYETKYGQLDLSQIPASIIAKVEVSKGASSVLYGPNGMGGVVNIITHQGSEGFSGKLDANVGEYGQNHQSAQLSYGHNGFTLFGTIEHTGRDAYRLSDDYEPIESYIKDRWGDLPKFMQVEDGGKRVNSDLESINARLRAGYSNDTTEVYASVYHFDTERGLPYHDSYNKVFATYSTFSDISEYQDQGIDLNASHILNDQVTLRAMAYYHTHTDTLSFYATPEQKQKMGDSSYDDYTIGGALYGDIALADWHSLSLSVNYKSDIHKQWVDHAIDPDLSDPTERSELETYSLAMEDTLRFGQLTVVAGVAWHQQTVIDFQGESAGNSLAGSGADESDTIDPMLGLSYAMNNGSRVFASVAKKTRFATFQDMKADDGKLYKLDPERSLSYAAGWEMDLGTGWLDQLSISGFYHDVDDRIGEQCIDRDPDDGYCNIATPVNIGTAEYYGSELTLAGDLTDSLRYSLDHTYTHARDKSADAETEYLRDLPRNEVTAILIWDEAITGVSANLRLNYKDKFMIQWDGDDTQWEKDVLTMDIGARKDFYNQQLTAYFNVNNLLDENYYEGDGQPTEGRNFEVGLTYRF